MKRAGVIAILILAFCGLADSAYIAKHEINATPLICDISSLSGCNALTVNSYSYLFGVPVALYGLIFYSTIFILSALELVVFDKIIRRILQVVSSIGFLGALYFTFIQVFVFTAPCVYCLISALIAALILILAMFIEQIGSKIPKQRLSLPPPPAPPQLLMPPPV